MNYKKVIKTHREDEIYLVTYEDVFTKIDLCRKHFINIGLGENYVDQFIR